MLTVWFGGFPPPDAATKSKLVALNPIIAGNGLLTVPTSTNARSAAGNELVD
jgi:hypothetical protein